MFGHGKCSTPASCCDKFLITDHQPELLRCYCRYLAEVSAKLVAASIPHDCVVGSLDDTGSILAAARKLGIPDFEGHLWLGSVLETLYVMRYERALARSGAAAPAGSPDGMSPAEVSIHGRMSEETFILLLSSKEIAVPASCDCGGQSPKEMPLTRQPYHHRVHEAVEHHRRLRGPYCTHTGHGQPVTNPGRNPET